MQHKVDQRLDGSIESSPEWELPWLEGWLNDYVFHLGEDEVVGRGSSDGLDQVPCSSLIFLRVGKQLVGNHE
jgi:hypothetical protein